jgi:hypothetical protein
MRGDEMFARDTSTIRIVAISLCHFGARAKLASPESSRGKNPC